MPANEAERPITRQDLRQLREGIKLDTQEFVRDAQTEILRAFHAFEKNREVRFARLNADVQNLDQEANTRIDNIEQRLMAIKERLLLNPPAKH